MRVFLAVVGLMSLSGCRGAQTERMVTSGLYAALQERAGSYPLDSVVLHSSDSALVVLTDSSYTSASVHAGTWMFGPPVTPEEAGKCPPEKVLGQRIARVLWWRLGADTTLNTVVVRVHGAQGIDRFSSTSMYYYLPQLRDPWPGDTLARRNAKSGAG